ncbi:helix-turn-helix domain-containing protein [Rubellimicrobium roseum]|uniref:helix-turn-helix domain-containing protein n=1 Tax=Rubellimicrobium roseum TaxID=687525 RepID=UPI001FE79F35|nr:cupin domain-containing protein [Rubellimicrobium roseum]
MLEIIQPSPDDVAPLGARIRERRKVLGLTLQAVAKEAGLTAGFISQVERGIAAPSLSSLTAIARVLGIDPSLLFAQPPGPETVTRHGARPVYGIDPNHMTYERISSTFPGNQIRAVLIHEAPGLRSEPISHEGEELFFILSGALTVEIEGHVFRLEAGDSLHFASTRVHSTWNHTNEPTTILHACTMDVFGETTRDRDA